MNTAHFSPEALAYDARFVYTCSCTHETPCNGCVTHNALFDALSDAEKALVEEQIEAGSLNALACVAG